MLVCLDVGLNAIMSVTYNKQQSCAIIMFTVLCVDQDRHLSATWPSGRLLRTGDRSYMTSLIHEWSRSHLTFITGGC